MNFKQVLQWIKGNPIAVGSAVVCLVSLIFVMIVIRSTGNTMLEDAAKRSIEIKKIQGYQSTPMKLPPEKTDSGARIVNGVVNKAAIDYLKRVFSQMQGDYNQIRDLAIKHNQGDATRGMHLPIIEGLFPDPGLRESVLYYARKPYEDSFSEMLGPDAQGAQYPRLNAGEPVPKVRLEKAVEPLERNLRARYGLQTNEALTPTQQIELQREKRTATIDLLRQNARAIHIYANVNAFQRDVWAAKPQIENVWESQLNLWIQQDIVQTISRTNRVSDPKANVIGSPIKRLNSIKVVPGYVGINSGGGMSSHSGYGQVASAETKLPDDFSIASSGRLSNTIYDVKHVWVDMDIDIQQLPIFMDELVQTNFMTVLKMELNDVDEYQLLSEGYFMGSADVVHVRMLIETLWLRAWVSPMMPKRIRELIGVPELNAEATQAMAQ